MGQTNHARPPGLATAGQARAKLVRLILGDLDQDWQLRSACRGHPRPDIFYPPPARADADIKRSQSERRRRIIIAEAKSVCRRCPVREECLAFADAIGDYNGIWGGKTARERGRPRDER
ncbi:WhiB family transcriptional regulator [Mycobacterium sp. MYCO198283]|uniref:WhiB family transcriptional regulator n=1 Tax=Mycobacterium sp. MYCO198283 TaxID=2883505 RepID=UPI0027DFA926|nr:WhiB family transcriptional regulator [Mycobacterium sp. MYCO198283]